jgi:hypothetical protein
MILRQTKFIVIVCASLICCSQAIAGGYVFHSTFETFVTGGSVVRKDDSSITIKELDTNRLIRFFFIHSGISFTANGNPRETPDTEVIVDDQTTTKDKIKIGMRAQIVFYQGGEDLGSKEKNFMKSVKAISTGKQKQAE